MKASADDTMPALTYLDCIYVQSQALFYDWYRRDRQKQIGNAIKTMARHATFAPDVVSRMYDMTVHMVRQWTDVAQSEKKKWDGCAIDGRIHCVRETLSAYEAAHKKTDFLYGDKKSVVTYMSPLAKFDSLARAQLHPKEDRFQLSHMLLTGSETQNMSAVVHEQGHFLLRDYHREQCQQMAEVDSNAIEAMSAFTKEYDLYGDGFTYDEQMDMCHDVLMRRIKTAGDDHFKSNAFGVLRSMDLVEKHDKRFKWYNHSPEEALVRTAQSYAALLFNQNRHTSLVVTTQSMRPRPRGEKYINYASAFQFIEETHIKNPDKGFFDLMAPE